MLPEKVKWTVAQVMNGEMQIAHESKLNRMQLFREKLEIERELYKGCINSCGMHKGLVGNNFPLSLPTQNIETSS